MYVLAPLFFYFYHIYNHKNHRGKGHKLKFYLGGSSSWVSKRFKHNFNPQKGQFWVSSSTYRPLSCPFRSLHKTHKTWIQIVKINENAPVSIIYLFYATIYLSIYDSSMIDYKLLYNLYTMDLMKMKRKL